MDNNHGQEPSVKYHLYRYRLLIRSPKMRKTIRNQVEHIRNRFSVIVERSRRGVTRHVPSPPAMEGGDAQPDDWTKLHWAVWCQDLDAVKELLRAGGNHLNTPDSLGWTPLHLACCSQTSRLWEHHQMGLRELDPGAGLGAVLTSRPGSPSRYSTLAYTFSRYSSETQNFAERTVSFMIALELLQAGADVRVECQGFCTALHCAASSGWVDHIDALLYFGASLGDANVGKCPPVCWAADPTSGRQSAMDYLRKKYGPDAWSRIREHSRSDSCNVGSIPEYEPPTKDFESWYFNEFTPDISRPCLPGTCGVVDVVKAISLCSLCGRMSLQALRSRTGFLHAKSIQDLRLSAAACSLCKFFCSFLERREEMTAEADVTQVILRAGLGPRSYSSPNVSGAFRLQLSGGCFCHNTPPSTVLGARSTDFQSCAGHCRSTLMEDIVFELFTSDCMSIGFSIMFLGANEGCEAEVSANSVVCGRIPAPDTRAEQSTALARSWFDRCQNDHDLCKSRSQGGVLPTRVIDVRDFQNSGQVTLVRGQEASGQYVAFSHRWMPGTPDTLPWVTTTLNEATRQQGFRASVLPHGIRDAITCTARLGIRYLWIDSLCILQDPAGDWERESVKMLDVFGNAAITLFADCSENDGFQFLKPRDTGNFQDRRGTEFGIEVECGSKMQIQILERYSRYQPRMPAKATDLFQSNVIGSSLSDRGWIFQEQVISSRRLHFGHHQMFWSCEQSFEAEDGTDLTHTCVPPHWYRWLFSPKYARRTGLDSHFGISDGQMEIWVQHVNWAMLVENYTRRSLTKGSDKLRALSALAKAFGVIYNDKYVVGNWAKCFRLNLLWSAKPRAGATTKTTKPCKAPYKEPHLSGSPIPSWSWLAADGAVDYPHLRADKTSRTEQTGLMHVYFQVLNEPECIPGEDGPFASLPIYCGAVGIWGVLEPALAQAFSPRATKADDADERLRLPWFHTHHGDTSQYIALYNSESILIGAMIPDRLHEPPPAHVKLLHAWQSRGMCPCSGCGGAVTPRYDHFIVLVEADWGKNTFRRVGFGWMYSRVDGHGRQSQPDNDNLLGLWRSPPSEFRIV